MINKNNNIISFLLVLLLLCPLINFGQTLKELENKKKKTEQEIQYTNKLLKEVKQNKQNTLHHLSLIEKKIVMRKELINSIKNEIQILEQKIQDNQQIINSLEEDLNKLKQEYARLIYYAYKHRDKYTRWMYILSSKSIDQAYKRLKYLQLITQYRIKQAIAIEATQKLLQKKQQQLALQKEEKEKLIQQQKKETNVLYSEKSDQNKLIEKLSQEEKKLRKELEKKRKAARDLNNAIEKLIAEEAAKSHNTDGTYKLTPEEKLISDQFDANKGRLPWPTQKGVIIESFGQHEHKTLKNVIVNNDGVSIATSKGAKARAIFNGVVKMVVTIPGKHKVVIIRHGEYLSVYSNLSEVYVTAGDNVSTKEEIGVIYTNEEDNSTVLDLQIRKGKIKLNPSLWLAKM
ncbi:MAG: peptidoglycan DD-metalloendopeptidase family protein [Marinilabiliales bacterium]